MKFFNGARGFGFITPDGGGADVFVHVSAVERAGLTSTDEGQTRQLPDPARHQGQRSEGREPEGRRIELELELC